ncbi:MAG: hypothetical protein J0I08_05105 [Rhizobiales bacterium]|jgi:uncharacterized low-complexity protein|nr:hypothetical protein [Hyphomicrobiales bacterium]
MKSLPALVALAVAAALSAAAPARADNRVFIIANQSDGYGIDECLANGQKCGVHAARAYCQSRDFTEATAFRGVDPEEVTGAIPASTGSRRQGSGSAGFIAITCHR